MPFVKPDRMNSLSVKVLLAYLAGVVLSIVLIALLAVAVMTFRSDLLFDTDLTERTEELAGKLRFDGAGVPLGFDASEDAQAWIYTSLKQEIAYRVLDAAGNVALSSAADVPFWPSNGPAGELKRGHFEFEREGVRIRGVTALAQHGGKTWFLQFGVSTRMMDLFYYQFALPFMGAGITLFSLVLLFVFGACALVTLGYTLKPLRQVSASAAAISPRSLHARLEVDKVPSEIVPLLESFNRVLERLEDGYRIQQEFLATAAHELKTPLALIRAQIELGQPGEERDMLLKDVEHMTRQVQQLLLLAEASEAQNYHFGLVDVHDVVGETVEYLQRMAQAAGVRLAASVAAKAEASTLWRADRGALFVLLKNLLENAIQHAPQGTEVSIELDAATLTVRDRGSGASEEQVARMFVRFWRGAHRRDHGAGLGLAICQEIARAHGWTLSAHSADPGLQLRLSRPEAERPEYRQEHQQEYQPE